MEANPTSAETNNLREFKSIGITRLSLGVQSLNDNDLLKLGRDHNSKDAIKSLEIAKKIFKNNVSFDLIFGRNNQNVSNWIKELKLALELADNHLSIYELTIKPGTPIYKEYKLGKLKIPSSDKITDMYESTIQIAKEFGFKQYEVSNFYKNSKYSRHNFGYWNGLDYLGIGPGAHGRLYDMKNNKRLRTFRILYPEDWMRQCEDLGHGMRKSVEMDLKTIKEVENKNNKMSKFLYKDLSNPNQNLKSNKNDDIATNEYDIYCPNIDNCASLILKTNSATWVERSNDLLKTPNQQQSDKSFLKNISSSSISDDNNTQGSYWKVSDMFSFENIGFSKTLNETGVKYLCCADCDLGPLGYHDTTNNDTKEYLIAVDRIIYYGRVPKTRKLFKTLHLENSLYYIKT
ncbi:12077_t:CDS:10 [Entrophospora sp. SA101]|nr:12077_t:CDS:10 [Entrophospora sp. SA101]